MKETIRKSLGSLHSHQTPNQNQPTTRTALINSTDPSLYASPRRSSVMSSFPRRPIVHNPDGAGASIKRERSVSGSGTEQGGLKKRLVQKDESRPGSVDPQASALKKRSSEESLSSGKSVAGPLSEKDADDHRKLMGFITGSKLLGESKDEICVTWKLVGRWCGIHPQGVTGVRLDNSRVAHLKTIRIALEKGTLGKFAALDNVERLQVLVTRAIADVTSKRDA